MRPAVPPIALCRRMRFMRQTWMLWLILAAPLAGAQAPMLKCADAGGHVTYSNLPCEKQGLKEVGQVVDRNTTMPLGPAPKPAAATAQRSAPPTAKDDPENL